MKFEDTNLPKHPSIEKAFAELVRLDAQDKFTTRGVLIAHIIATESTSKDPDAIAAGLLIPLASDGGPVLLAQAALPGRVPEIIQSVFDLGGMTMRGEPIETFYKQLDSGVRSVVLASSFRMFEVMEGEMEASLAASRKAGAQADRQYLQDSLQPLKKFAGMICKAETEETGLAKKCEDAVTRIEDIISGPPAPPTAKKDSSPKP